MSKGSPVAKGLGTPGTEYGSSQSWRWEGPGHGGKRGPAGHAGVIVVQCVLCSLI